MPVNRLGPVVKRQSPIYADFNLRLLSLLIIFLLATDLASWPALKASAYDVTAKVSAPIPSVPAAILSPSSNITVHSPVIALSGTCQALTPSIIVSIWRANVFLGSAVCDNSGNFSLLVTLPLGSSSLIAKCENVTYDYGVDSPVFHINYIPTISADTPSASDINPAPLEAKTLQIETDDQFVTFSLNAETSLSFNIKDGEAPYTLVVDWGDGSHETFHFASPGKQTIRHIFKNSLSRSVKLVITDKNNKSVELVLGAVTLAAGKPLAKLNSRQFLDTNLKKAAAVATIILVAAGGAVWPKFKLQKVQSTKSLKRPKKRPFRGKK